MLIKTAVIEHMFFVFLECIIPEVITVNGVAADVLATQGNPIICYLDYANVLRVFLILSMRTPVCPGKTEAADIMPADNLGPVSI